MQAYILNPDFRSIAVIDDYESFIWTDRYYKEGDFELYTAADFRILNFTKQDYYVWYTGSEHMMIIEGNESLSDAQDGGKFIITGRSLESILDRRIVWNQTILTGNLQNGIKKLITENIISPTIVERTISNFIFEDSDDPSITSLLIDAQYTGDNLLVVISELCKTNNIGFKITLNDQKQFVFKLYNGVNRSYDQNDNPYVVFSPKYENIINSDYLDSKKAYKNVSLIAGEEIDNVRKRTTTGNVSGLERRELYTDARDISSKDGDIILSDAQYVAQLVQRGIEDLSKNAIVRTFDGKVETSYMFVYGTDFFLGDIVQVVNEFNIESKSRVIEMIITQDTKGFSAYPTFDIINEEE